MTISIETDHGFYLGSQAWLLDDTKETAWAEKHVIRNRAHAWVLGRFVEADRANSNRQYFSLDGLRMAQPTIAHSPMNINHADHRIVGSFVATELVYPTGEGSALNPANLPPRNPDGSFPDEYGACADCGFMWIPNTTEMDTCPNCGGDNVKMVPKGFTWDSAPEGFSWDAAKASLGLPGLNPYIEALGVMWKGHFPDEYAKIEQANKMGGLAFSMECVPAKVGCVGVGGCGGIYEYAGRTSPSYCDHLNEGKADKDLIDPHFTAGALLLPPVRPGWSEAHVKTLVAQYADEAEKLYEGVRVEFPHLDSHQWESMMASLLQHVEARDFTQDKRKKMADAGMAMPDGSFPIANVSDLKNAIKLAGRSKNPSAAKAHIKKMAKKLGREDLIPADW